MPVSEHSEQAVHADERPQAAMSAVFFAPAFCEEWSRGA
jgi:hypothetical protein